MKATLVRIQKASLPTFWYVNHIGQEFWVNHNYEVIDPTGAYDFNTIESQDAEVIRQAEIEIRPVIVEV